MDKYAKLFTKFALGYLLLGVGLGVAVGIDPTLSPRLRFVHIHLNLFGFMVMMIAGVAYHVLPRFNARPVPWPDGVKYHFILQNVGLLGMVATYMGGGLWSGGVLHVLFVVFALIAAVSLVIMVYNLGGVLVPLKPEVEKPLNITADMKVGEVLGMFPESLAVFLAIGFSALANPLARKAFANLVTIEKACEKHRVNVDEFLHKLNSTLFGKNHPSGSRAPESAPEPPVASASQGGATIKKGEYCKGDVMVGSLIKAYPETKTVFEKHYGEGCFSCPGQTFETVEQTAQMHNINADVILKDINAVIESQLRVR